MKRIACTVVASLLSVPLAFAADPSCPPTGASAKAAATCPSCPPTAGPATEGKVTLKVTGMTCGKCASSVATALTKVEGVTAADVNLDQGHAVVAGRAGVKVDQLIAAVDQAGGSRHTFKAEQVVAKDTKAVAPKLVSLFGVPLVCSAAPEIGCGSRAKPILLDLERDSNIAQAWLNSAGTVLAVVGTEGSSRESRAKAVQAALEAKKATATELDGDTREQQLKSFVSAAGWHRGAEVDTLSKQEAGIIAARLVRRIQAQRTLPHDKGKALERGFADAFSRSFTSTTDNEELTREEQRNQALLKVAQAHLDENGVAAFKEAIAKGYRPQSSEK